MRSGHLDPQTGTSGPTGPTRGQSGRCPQCLSQLSTLTVEATPKDGLERYLPQGNKGDKAPDKAFPASLAEPLPEPGYPDQLETRDRFTAEVQARHHDLLRGRPRPDLLLDRVPGPLAGAQRGPRDPLGSEPVCDTQVTAEARQGHDLPPPALGTPKVEDQQRTGSQDAGGPRKARGT